MIHTFAASLVALPPELKGAIAIGVLAVVRLILEGRVPDKFVTELAGIITTGIIAVVELALGLVPASFEGVAVAVLNLLAVLLGTILVGRVYLVAHASAKTWGLKL